MPDRSCVLKSDGEACSGSDSICVCVPPAFTDCTADSDCETGEECKRRFDIPYVCIDNELGGQTPTDPGEPPITRCTGSSTPPSGGGDGLGYEKCLSHDECADGRECYNLVEAACCSELNSETCVCVKPFPVFCQEDGECDSGEACLGNAVNPPRCVSNRARDAFGHANVDGSGANGDGGDNTCIDAAALRHLAPHQLLLASHRHARVLCDPSGSCATPGHIVLFRGTPMMMRRYCSLVQCVEQVRLVNSPRWGRQLRVKSETSGLEYTAFAARWESRLEEHMLRTAINVGL